MAPFKSSKSQNASNLLNIFRTSNLGQNLGTSDTIIMTGGTTVVSNNIQYHIFTSSDTLAIASGEGSIYYTIVAGGGGGAGYGPAYFGGVKGSDSTAFGFTAVGGGAGGAYPGGGGGAGGSGGGGGGPSAVGGAGENYPGPTQQGFPGGQGSGTYVGGGGGGAGAVGGDGTPTANGPGGDGKVLLDSAPGDYRTNIPPSYGTPGPTPGRWVAGGGGAGSGSTPTRGTGGAGGGADGGKALPDPVTGVVNTGGGGGGFENGGSGGGAGGGGAGGYITGELTDITPQSGPYSIVIGGGGSPAPGPATNSGGSGIVIVAAINQSAI